MNLSAMERDEALQLIEGGESQRVEFKTSFAEENAAIESLGAFANAKGGTVLIGVKPDGTIVGVDLGANTLENFSNRVRESSQPPLYPRIELLEMDGKIVVAASIEKLGLGQVVYVFNSPKIRVGRANQVMSPEEQRTRLKQGNDADSAERDRPRFEVIQASTVRLERQFSPAFNMSQSSGDRVADLEWRMTGSRFSMEWRPTEASALSKTHFVNSFDLTFGSDEAVVQEDELVFEIRFWWRDRWHREIHRWPMTRRELPGKILWDLGTKLLPTATVDDLS